MSTSSSAPPFYRSIAFWIATVAATVVLTWWEWLEHHPPDIALVTLVHFVFVFVVLALLFESRRWLARRH